MPLIEQRTRGDKHGFKFKFHDGQTKAYYSDKRIIAVIAGVRSGKTSFAPCWLYQEMRRCGPGDYLVATPDYKIADKAAAPELEYLFASCFHLGELKHSPLQFDFSEYGCKAIWGKVPERQPRILFGHADEPQSLAAMTVKAAWLDEAGQNKFKLGSWYEVCARVAIDRGRILITSTPYNLGWLKSQIHDPWKAAHGNHPEIDVINFDSRSNPSFPKEEYERARLNLPGWKFRMMYQGVFERPAGLIYDCFGEANVCPAFSIPADWPRYAGVDFGAPNMAAVFAAQELAAEPAQIPGRLPGERKPTGKVFIYADYKPNQSATAREHAQAMLRTAQRHCDNPEKMRRPMFVGGSLSEGQWRAEFRSAGLAFRDPPPLVGALGEPATAAAGRSPVVQVGIERVYGALKTGDLVIFDELTSLIDDFNSYARETDDDGEPTEKIADKEKWHRMDAVRYLCTLLWRGLRKPVVG